MRVFLTGATGFIGSRIVGELIGAGHQVLGLTRSDAGAHWLKKAGADVHHGDLEHPDSIATGASQADAVIHTAFDHDFSRFVANVEKDRRVIQAIGAVLIGSDRPFLITSGTGMGNRGPGLPALENSFDRDNPNPRKMSELTGEEWAKQGVSVAAVRLPQVHDTEKQGLVSPLIQIAKAKGISAYVGDGANRWPAGHVTDVARLYRLALEQHRSGARWHAVAEEGITMRKIAEMIGAGLGVPVVSITSAEAAGHFGPFGHFVGIDMPASSTLTREQLGWEPTGPGLIEDLQNMGPISVLTSG
ncbi:SDR family oxidoreductase [Achromobacter marplatensis]|jgi:nucleoside-diphosphate-sugar epimerase|uniref:SDR family oxidoreductase n=1 Tax=Achromobacter marplatensis TaxID=470868 RepID=A0AA42WDP5_9BURK|nr:SDR family oxidoreductase [Achromobacter marplatensis]MDH2053280.1 SDR family oxidoreductase [Achromobacter marplatensis]